MAGTIKAIYAIAPNFSAVDNFPDSTRYAISGYIVDAIGGEPSTGEVAAYLASALSPRNPPAVFGCRLAINDENSIGISALNGRSLFINGTNQIIPVAGANLANTGLTAGTLYHIYAYLSGSTITLEASTTAPATGAEYGHLVKLNDQTRTYLGMVYMGPGTPGTFQDHPRQRLVASYFNRILKPAQYVLGTNRTTTSDSYVEMSSSDRVEFLSFGDEHFDTWFDAVTSCVGTTFLALGVNGVSTLIKESASNIATSAIYIAGRLGYLFPFGYNYATLAGKSTAFETLTVNANTSGIGVMPRI